MNVDVTVNVRFASDQDMHETMLAARIIDTLSKEASRQASAPDSFIEAKLSKPIPTGIAAATKYAKKISATR